MKILLAHNFYRSTAPSGEDMVYRDERALLEANNVAIIPYERFNDDIDESTLFKRLALGYETAWSKKTYDQVAELICRMRPDIAHFHNTFPLISPSAYAACHDNGVPVVQTLHNYRLICPGGLLLRDGHPCEDCVGTNLFPALRHRCYRGSLPATAAVVWMLARNRWSGAYSNLVDRYIALTNFQADRLIAGGLPAEKISVKPNFLPNDVPLGEGNKRCCAVYVGRLTKEKGVKTLLQAWRNFPNLPLKIIGDGALRDELENYARRHSVNAEFMGLCDRCDVLDAVAGAFLQVVPSEWYEGFPLVIVEAYACGTPVVASRIGSLAELVENGKTGVLFKPGSSKELAERIGNYIRHQSFKDFSKAARAKFESNYTPDENFNSLINIYSKVIFENMPNSLNIDN